MADNTVEEHLNDPTNTQSKNTSDEIVPTEDTEIINLIQEPENMEVHRHAHSSHEKKSWKSYGWEFLMLFLAVFCGFLAEYQLEHVIENQREKQYVESLIADLKSDQEIIPQHIKDIKETIVMMDSINIILNTPSLIANSSGQLYYLARLGPRLRPLANSNKTFEQLKNSGNFRLLKSIATSNKIMSYYEKFTLTRLLESVSKDEFNDYKKVVAKVFDPTIFIKMESENGVIERTNDNPLLRTTNNELLKELSVFSVYLNGSKKAIIDNDEQIKIAGAELITYLQKEYHLDSN